LNTITDNSLMLKVKAGDLDKMGILFERYNRALYGYLFHSTGQRVESEDLVQTVFYRMLKYRQSFNEIGEFRAWMYQLARNALIDSAKKNSRTFYQADIAKTSELYEKEENFEGNLLETESVELIQKALNKLPDEQRELLILSKFQELPYREIAEILGTSEGNIKVKIHRAVNDLRSIYLKNYS
jgi:RNA polymerase sigma factor (sigma-70 family)